MDDITSRLKEMGMKVYEGPTAVQELARDLILPLHPREEKPKEPKIMSNPYHAYLLGMINALKLVVEEKREPAAFLREANKKMEEFKKKGK